MMTDTEKEPVAKPDSARAFGKWFAATFLSLQDLLAETSTQAERRAATDSYMSNRGIAYAGWKAGCDHERAGLPEALTEIIEAIEEDLRRELGETMPTTTKNLSRRLRERFQPLMDKL